MKPIELEGDVRVVILYHQFGEATFDPRQQAASYIGALKLDHPDLSGVQTYQDVDLGSDVFELRFETEAAIQPFSARARKIPGGFRVTVCIDGKNFRADAKY